MDIRTIKTFKAIVQFGSFQKAADELNYAQSTITSHIQKLEKIIGTPLFERDNRLRLTKTGLLLNEKSDVLLQSFDQLTIAMENITESPASYIQIGVMEPFASYHFPSVIKQFAEQYSDTQINIHIEGSQMLAELVSNGELDVAICTEQKKYNHLNFEPIDKEAVRLLVHQSNDLANEDAIHLSHLKNEHLITTRISCPFRYHLEKFLLKKGVLPNYTMEVNNLLATKHYVQANLGSAIVPAMSVNERPKHTVVKRIVDLEESITIGLLTRENMQLSEQLTGLKILLKQRL
ncbi:MAG TPA: LysR family transcriptional regulator [Bacillota bacterium]|nr:LysR family transcriptional regulator [Bacillota bacterium]